MSEQLDARLRSLFGELAAPSGFDAAVLARVAVESSAVAAAAARRAQLAEDRRYRSARRALSWTNWIRRIFTLDTVGIAVLAAFALRLMLTRVPPEAFDLLDRYAPEVLTGVGVLLGLVPVTVMLLGPSRRRFGLA